jgi:alanyl-tRNA synthetase
MIGDSIESIHYKQALTLALSRWERGLLTKHNPMKTNELREKYLAFFETKGCTRRPSDVLVPRWDPSVLFTPAGMNQFKDHFLGRCKLEFTRATTCQKCLRTGDIDNVGRTAYHHTFFEMLGNFSFGDYFKREAIHWAWEFLTDKKWLGLAPERLSATVYLDDDEAAGIWLNEIKLPPERLQRLGEDENFWPANAPSQGPDGVCGPCSEIYYNTEFGSVEIWNLVFTQFNRVGDPPNNLRPLPSRNIDTGMGLERTAAVLQGVDTNFHIDILRPLVEAAGEVCGVRYQPDSENGRRLRRIADHVRACAFAIHENVIPGPNKEKYVIKRLLRRAVLDGHQMGKREPFLFKLVDVVADLMREPYPDLTETVGKVANVIEKEEDHFLSTIDAGLDRIERIFEQMRGEHRGMVSGAEAADMFQTHGFPPELFETLAAERNFTFDWPSFQEEMKKHGDISGPTEKALLFKHDPLEALKKAMHGSTFVGYEADEVKGAKVLGIISNDQLCDRIDEVDHERPIILVLDKTPFYGEMGGQVGDLGEIVGEQFRFEVTDAQVEGGFTLHVGHLREGKVELGAICSARVDAARRQGIRRAHSATHLLHYALRKHLGEHAMQQGSKVDNDLLRFDFANPSAVGLEELQRIEIEVNEKVMAGLPIGSKNMPIAEARKSGAMMLFGEKYPDVVRVVSAGDFSKELCGGTHLQNTGQIGLFKIISEESVAAGTRRITALTGRGALEYLQKLQTTLLKSASMLKVASDALPDRLESLVKDLRELKKKAAGQKSEGVGVDQLLAGAVEIAGVKVIIAEVPGEPNDLRQLLDLLRRKAVPLAVMLGNKNDEEKKVTLIAGLTRDLLEKKLDAVAWVRSASSIVGGSGGGRPDMAQAGGKIPEKLGEAFAAAKEAIEKMLSK